VKLEEERLSFADFNRRKNLGEFPIESLPVLLVGDEMFCQTNSILRYIGKLTGLYPTEPLQALKCDQVLDTVEEVLTHICPTMTISIEQDRKAARKHLCDNVFPKYFKALNAWSKGGHVIKKTLTIADLAIQNLVHLLTAWGRMDHIPKEFFLINAPNCVKVHDIVIANPKVHNYRLEHLDGDFPTKEEAREPNIGRYVCKFSGGESKQEAIDKDIGNTTHADARHAALAREEKV
jgi:hypothetical protein